MTKPRSELKDIPASVHARLLAFAKREDRDFNQVLTQYFQERLLDRLAQSRYAEQFALKGALLFVALEEGSQAVRGRPTKDIDLEALRLRPEPQQIGAIFAEIGALPSDPVDGVVFLIKDLEAEQIVDQEEYEAFAFISQPSLARCGTGSRLTLGSGTRSHRNHSGRLSRRCSMSTYRRSCSPTRSRQSSQRSSRRRSIWPKRTAG